MNTIPGALAAAADAWPDREALVGRDARYTYAELAAEVEHTAGRLWAAGLRPGDRIAVTMPNTPEMVVTFFAAMRVGAIWVGVNQALAAPERAFMYDDCTVSLVLDEQRRLDRALVALPEIDIDPHAPAAIAYTSGTTGFPKGAVHSQHNLLLPGRVQRETRTYEPDLRQGVCLPLTVLNLLVLAPLVTIQLGSTLVCMDRIDPVGMAEWIRTERIATFSAVPAMIHGLLTHPEIVDDDLRSLTRPGVGGADLPEAFRDLYRARFGCEVTIGYGLTEAPTAVTVTDPNRPPIPNEAGVALPHVEVDVRDEAGRVLGPGEVGEICVGARRDGPWKGVYTTMLGYWNRPEATATALRDGVLHTGDLGYLDADGHLFVKDRRNDLIIRGGANVYPAEVERVLHADPRVAACAVIGAPDDHYGQIVVAFVQRAPGPAASDTELQQYCATQLARYKVPDRFVFVGDFPRTPMGKIRKVDLVEQLP